MIVYSNRPDPIHYMGQQLAQIRGDITSYYFVYAAYVTIQ